MFCRLLIYDAIKICLLLMQEHTEGLVLNTNISTDMP